MPMFDQQEQQVRSQNNIAPLQDSIGQIGDVISGETVNIRQELVARSPSTTPPLTLTMKLAGRRSSIGREVGAGHGRGSLPPRAWE